MRRRGRRICKDSCRTYEGPAWGHSRQRLGGVEDNGMMAGAADVAANAVQNPRAVPSLAIGPERLVGDDLIDPVARGLPIGTFHI